MMKTIYLAGGCFWGVQHYFDQFDGILNTTVGYANVYPFAMFLRIVTIQIIIFVFG